MPPEEQLLTDFFDAARAYDTTVMARLSAVAMNPRSDGIVDSFRIERIDRAADTSEQVHVVARVRAFDGQTATRELVFTVARQDGRWFIRNWTAGAGAGP